MTRVFGPTVYVLGAGASVHAGAPMLRDFMTTARFVSHSGTPTALRHYSEMAELFQYLDKLRSAAYYVDSDLDNLEEVFSLLEMGQQLGDATCAKQVANLRWTVFETLDSTTQARWVGDKKWPSSTYLQFVETLVQLRKARAVLTQEPSLATVSDTVITFNYDVLLDHAFEHAEVPITYGLSTDLGEGMPLLKLHGSLNWGTCRRCGSGPQVISATSDAGLGGKKPTAAPGRGVALKVATVALPATPCATCDARDSLEPVIVPPTWSKLIAGSPLVPVWNHAVEALRRASQVVIVGYSMPVTDTFLRYLFAIALRDNSWFNRVVVVNPNIAPELRNRYEAVFARGLGARGKLIFLDASTFEVFVGRHMVQCGERL